MTIERSAMLRGVRRAAGRGVGAFAVLLLAVGCSEEPTVPLNDAVGSERPGGWTHAVQMLECTVDISRGGNLECEPAAGANGVSSGGPSYNLIVGSQHRFVRLSNTTPVMDGTTWEANVRIQNLTLQPFGTLDGMTAEETGVRVFFVKEPTNGVEVSNHDGEDEFTETGPQKYYEYSGSLLGDSGILTPGDTSGAKTWRFRLPEGVSTFQFAVLVWTTVPDPEAYSVRLTRISASTYHTCADGDDGRVYCWGWNDYGQLGANTTIERTTPVAVQAPPGVVLSGVSTGFDYTCANGNDGKVYCWGKNDYGQLGEGTTPDHTNLVAVDAPAGVTLSGVSAGSQHTCAVSVDGPAYCWGSNTYSQLGDGGGGGFGDHVRVPVPVAGTH